MLGFSEKELLGRSALDLVHRSDVAEAMRIEPRVQYGGPDQVDFEGRLVGRDGATTWCTAAVAPIDLRDGHAEAYVLILEDITEHRRQQEFAATIQRRLLPQAPPTLPGYRLAGACLPAQEVAGDLGDWSLTASGSLDITVADVMGKGMAAALVTARVRTALRLTGARASLFGFVAGPTRAPRLASRPCEQTSELTRSAIGPGPC